MQKEGVEDDIDARSLLTFHKLGEVGSVPFRTIPFPVGASPDFCFQREPNSPSPVSFCAKSTKY